MDPLTALSLAGTIIQFVDFGSKLCSQGYELYTSTSGKLKADEELELITTDLSGLINKIKHADTQKAPSVSNLTAIHGANTQKTGFEKICDEAIKIAEMILAKLDKLNIDETKNRKVETFKRVWVRVCSQREIEELVRRLSRLKDVVITEALAAILHNTNELNVRTSARFGSLDRQTQLLLSSLLESNQATTREVMSAVAQLMRRLDDSDAENKSLQARYRIIDRRAEDEKLKSIGSIATAVEMLSVPRKEEESLRIAVQQMILEHLSYPAMTRRYEQVVDAHPTTFDWIFQDLEHEKQRCTSLATWLKTGNGLYWISGKPGSGKSTLMKHICDEIRTRLYLKKWAQIGGPTPVPLLIGTFFFWTSGTLEQRSQVGMLRSVLFQILQQKPGLLPVVFPSLWAKQYEQRVNNEVSAWSETWTLRVLLDGFRRLITQRVIDTRIFFLIDGLDEFDGDHEVLAELFNEIVRASDQDHINRIKCCVSSRPWVVFQENFEGCPTLRLQDLTFDDINTFVTEKTLTNGAFKRLAEEEPQATSALIQEIVAKAEGVFLWVHVVVLDLLRGIRKRDTLPDLWKRLEALPDLELLYRQIMSHIEPAHLVWASKTFQIARATREVRVPKAFYRGRYGSKQLEGFISIGELFFALDDNLTETSIEKISQDEFESKSRDTAYHVIARCACLLEVVKANNQTETTSRDLVQYLHRTARDFLERTEQWNEVLDTTRNIQFDPWHCMMRCNSLMLHWLGNQNNTVMAEQSWLSDTVIVILAFATTADADVASHLQQTRIMDDANSMLAHHDINLVGVHFTLGLLSVPDSIKTITAGALGLNVSHYVAAELQDLSSRNPRAAKTTAGLMLYERIHADTFHGEGGLPLISIRMASVLIGFGADVNYKKNETTAWEKFLSLEILRLSVLDVDKPKNSPEFARLMNLFLKSGANIYVCLKGTSSLITLLEFFNTYVRPNYLNDRGDILEIEMALTPHKPKINSHFGLKPEKRRWWKR